MSTAIPGGSTPAPAGAQTLPPSADHQKDKASKKVSFDQIAEAYYGMLDQRLDEQTRLQYAKAYEDLLYKFQEAHGIEEVYWGGGDQRYASVLTSDDNVFDVAPGPEVTTLDLYQLMWDCEKLVIEARLNLKGTARKIAMKRLFEVITNIMDTLAKQSRVKPAAGAAAVPDKILDFFKGQVQASQDYYESMAQRSGLSYYLSGTAVGVGIISGLLALVFLSHAVSTSSGVSVDALAAFISGAAGGAVGVMSRMLNSDLKVQTDAGRTSIFVGGLFRPIVGGVLGSAFFAAVFSGLIPLTVPADSSKALAYYAILAFVGGIAERWAQDTLVQSGEGIFGTASKGTTLTQANKEEIAEVVAEALKGKPKKNQEADEAG